MAWEDISTVSGGDAITSARQNKVIGNLNYLLDPNKDIAQYNAGSHYTTTSATFADVDATNVTATLETYGGPVLVYFNGTVSATGGSTNIEVGFDFTVDGTRHASANTEGLLAGSGVIGSGNRHGSSFCVIVTGLSAGSHTFNLQWARLSGDRTAQLWSTTATNPVTFGAIEL